MADINDTTTYPNTTPALGDHVIGTDVSNTSNDADGETVTFTWQSVMDLFEANMTVPTSVTAAIGTSIQAYDADLAAIAGLTSAADRFPYYTGAGTAALATLTSFARTILDDADAATVRATIGTVIGTDVQAYDAELAAIAGITFAQGDILYHNGTALVKLGAGTSGQYLQTQGAAANPQWATVTASATTGAGAPGTTPSAEGAIYVDTTGDTAYISTGTASSADWDEILTAASGTTLTDTTAVVADKLPFFDASDSDNPKQDAIGDILKLKPEAIVLAVSDETTALTTGTAKTTFRMPYAFTLTAVRASVTTAPVGSVLTVDINEGGTSILSTKLTIDASEKTSTTAATAAVISDSALADDAEITIDIDAVGSGTAGAGLKVYLIGTQA